MKAALKRGRGDGFMQEKKREEEGGEEVTKGITRRQDATSLPALALIIRLWLFGAGVRAASLLLVRCD